MSRPVSDHVVSCCMHNDAAPQSGRERTSPAKPHQRIRRRGPRSLHAIHTRQLKYQQRRQPPGTANLADVPDALINSTQIYRFHESAQIIDTSLQFSGQNVSQSSEHFDIIKDSSLSNTTIDVTPAKILILCCNIRSCTKNSAELDYLIEKQPADIICFFKKHG